MEALVTKVFLDGYKYVADSTRNSAIWPQFVSEAQLLDVKIQIGDGLLNELVTQFIAGTLTALNNTLLDGGNYTYNSKVYLFQGLKAAIMYYAFGRFTNRVPFNYTALGVVKKESDFSDPASDKAIQRLETESRLTADAIMCENILYLNRHTADYPLWRVYGCGYRAGCKDKRPFKMIGD